MKAQGKRNIYWEKQGVDQLCGVHALNSFLQGPYFNEITLSNIALELDKKQKDLMMEQGVTKDFLKYMGEDSGNVAMDGNFSVQVIQEALKTLNLTLHSIQKFDKGEDLTSKKGFICNSVAHWFTMRKIDGVWYNLNSCNKRLPEIISEFYLSAFLISVRNSGYTIFSVEGQYPESNEQKFDYYNPNQQWYPSLRILRYHEKCIKRKGFKPNIGGAGGGDKQMEKAIAASLGKDYKEYHSSGQDSDWDNPKKKVKPFIGQGKQIGGDVAVNYDKFLMDKEDMEMFTSIRVSLQQIYKQEPKQGILVTFRHSSGKKQRRTFQKEATVQNLYDYIWLNSNPNHLFYLVNGAGKQKLLDVSIPLAAILDEDQEASVYVTDQ